MKNEYTMSQDGKTAYVKLTQGQVAIIDAEDLEKISTHRWCAAWCPNRKCYVAATNVYESGKRVGLMYMHRLIMDAKKGEVVDHIDGNPLNNRKGNLRICTLKNNNTNHPKRIDNTSGRKGVYKTNGKWEASIRINGKLTHLGYFDSFDEAVAVRTFYEKQIYGEFVSDREKVVHSRPQKRNRLPEPFYSEEYGNVYRVPLTKGKYAIIDTIDREKVSKYVWHVIEKNNGMFYAQTDVTINNKNVSISLHRYITDAADAYVVDHINGDGLDDRQSNLRVCTNKQNIRNSKIRSDNSSGYKGVVKIRNKWRASITVDGKTIYLGLYDSPEEAHSSYCEAAERYFGEFARYE